MKDNDLPHLILAPMEGVTDVVMRDLLTSLGGIDICVSEFLRVSNHIPPKRIIKEHIPESDYNWKTPSGILVIPQILGGDPKKMGLTAKRLEEMGAPAVDINFGCPAKTVNRHDGGASILKCPSRLREIIMSVKENLKQIPVTAKIRLGWEDPAEVFEIIKFIDQCNVRWLTVHARTKEEGYKPPAHWELLSQIKKSIKTPVIANGDIFSKDDYEKCKVVTECNHFMIGRGVLQDPFIFLKIRNHKNNVDTLEVLESFIQKSIRYYGNNKAGTGRTKQFVKQLSIKNPLIKKLFDEIKIMADFEEILGALRKVKKPTTPRLALHSGLPNH